MRRRYEVLLTLLISTLVGCLLGWLLITVFFWAIEPGVSVERPSTTTSTLAATSTSIVVSTTSTSTTSTTVVPPVVEPEPEPPLVEVDPPVPPESEPEPEYATPDWGVGTGQCGGDLPPCSTMGVESGGDPNAVNETGCGGRGCYGKWQFDPLTSQSLGYPLPMNQYDEATQDEAARALWDNGQGCSHWGLC